MEVEGGRVKQAHSGDVNCVRLGPMNRERRRLRMPWNSRLPFESLRLEHPALPSHRVLASCGDDGAVRLWRISDA